MSSFDGLFLSNGPGDPKHGLPAARNVAALMDSQWWCNRPIFGICMGNQILGLAAGMETYRMPYGNRGHNQPVLALASSGVIKKGRMYVTSQNRTSPFSTLSFVIRVRIFADSLQIAVTFALPVLATMQTSTQSS
jgi:carbamoylphosphate synthase small subunit